jgi:hypothetical protein
MKHADPAPHSGSGVFKRLFYSVAGFVLQTCIELLVRVSGRRVLKRDAPWLDCIIGRAGFNGAELYRRIAEEKKLDLSTPAEAGLVSDFADLRGPAFDPDKVHSAIRHFYEHAAAYHLDFSRPYHLAIALQNDFGAKIKIESSNA